MATVTATTTIKFADTLDITLLTPEQIAKFTDKDFAAFSTQQQADLTAEQVKLLTAKQLALLPTKLLEPETIAAIDPKVIAGLLDPKLVSVFSIKGLSADQFSSLTPEQLKNIPALQFADLTTAQADLLTDTQAAVLTADQISNLSAKAVGALTATTVEALPITAISGFTAKNIIGLTTDTITALTIEQAAALGSKQVSALTPLLVREMELDDVAALSTAAMRGFTTKNIISLSLSALTSEQFGALASKQVASLTTAQLESLNSEFAPLLTSKAIGAMSSAQIGVLSTEVVTALDPIAVKGFNAKNIKGLTTSQVASITADQAVNLSRVQLKALASDQVAALNVDSVLAIKPIIFKGLSGALMENLAPTVFTSFSDEQIANLTSAHIASLQSTQVAALSGSQLAGMKPTAIAGLTTTGIQGITTDAVSSLTALQLAKFSTASAGQLESFTPAQAKQFSDDVKTWLATKNYATVQSAETNTTGTKGIYTSGTTIAGETVAETITGTSGADVISTGGTTGDKITAGAGNDTITLTSVAAGHAHTVDGGAGTADELILPTAAFYTSSDFTNVSNIEKVTLSADGNQALVLNTGNNAFTNVGATALTDAKTLTLTGSYAANKVAVSLVAGDLDASGYTGLGLNVTATTGTNIIKTGSGSDSIDGGAGADTITAGAGVDTITGGADADTFVFAAGANGATPTSTVFDTITDFLTGADVIDFGTTEISISPVLTTATQGTAQILPTGKAVFHDLDDTLAERVTAVVSALGSGVAGETVLFTDINNTDAYVFVSDGTATAGANDVLIKLSGKGSAASLGIVSGDITSLSPLTVVTGASGVPSLASYATTDSVHLVAATAAILNETANKAALIANIDKIDSITATDGLAITFTPAEFATAGVASALAIGSATVVATSATQAQLTAIVDNITKIAAGGITGTSVPFTAAQFATTGVATALANGVATVVATGADSTQVTALVDNAAKLAAGGITGTIALTPTEFATSGVVTALAANTATVAVTSPTSTQVASLFAGATKIKDGGITVTTGMAVTDTQFATLAAKITATATVTVNATDATAAEVITIVDNISKIATTGVSLGITGTGIALTAAQFNAIHAKLATGVTVTVDATGATTAELSTLAAGVANSQVAEITNLTITNEQVAVTADYNGDSDTSDTGEVLTTIQVITNLLSKVQNGTAQVVATDLTADQITALATNVAKIATSGITAPVATVLGSATPITEEQFATLLTKIGTNVTVDIDATSASAANLKIISDNNSKVHSITNLSLTLANDIDTTTASGAARVTANNTITENLLNKAVAATVNAQGATTEEITSIYNNIGNIGTLTNSTSSVSAAQFVSLQSSLPTGVLIDATGATASELTYIYANQTKVGSITNLTLNLGNQSQAEIVYLLSKASTGTVKTDITGANAINAAGTITDYAPTLATNASKFATGGLTGTGLTLTQAQFAALGTKFATTVTDVTVNAATSTSANTAPLIATSDAELAVVSANIGRVGLVTGVTVRAANQTDVQTANLLAKSFAQDALVIADGATTNEVASIVSNISKIAALGITTADASLVVTPAQFTVLDTKLGSAASAPVNTVTVDTAAGATVSQLTDLSSNTNAYAINNLITGASQPDAEVVLLLAKATGTNAVVANSTVLTAAEFVTHEPKLASTTAVTVDATNALISGGNTRLATLSTNIDNVYSITNLTLDTNTSSATQTNNLLSKAAAGTAKVVATGAIEAEIDSMVTYVANIETGSSTTTGITGTLTVTDTQFGVLYPKLATTTGSTVTVNAAGATTAELTTIAAQAALVDSLTSLLINTTNGATTEVTTSAEITTLLNSAVAAGAVGEAKVNATNATEAEVTAIIGKLSKVAANGISGALPVTVNNDVTTDTSTVVTDGSGFATLFAKYVGDSALVTATGMVSAQINAIGAVASKIATGGITGSATLTNTQFNTLTTALNASATLTTSGASWAATDLTAMDTKATPAVVASTVTTITGTAAEVAAVAGSAGITKAANYAVTLSGSTNSVTNANTIDANTTGVITGTITAGTASALTALTGTGNAYTLTVTDTTAATAAQLNTLDTYTTVDVIVSSVTAITDSYSNVNTLYTNTANFTGLGDEAITLNDATVTATEANTIANATSGIVTATIATDALATINTALANAASTDALTITINDTTAATAALLNTLDGKTSVDIIASSITAITDAYADVYTTYVTNIANFTGLGNEDITLSDGTLTATQVNNIANATSGNVTATVTADTAAALNTALANGSSTDVLTLTVSAGSVAASVITALDGKTNVDVDITAVTAITGTGAEVAALAGEITGSTVSALSANPTITATAATDAEAATIFSMTTTGVITVELVNAYVSGGSVSMKVSDVLDIDASNTVTALSNLVANAGLVVAAGDYNYTGTTFTWYDDAAGNADSITLTGTATVTVSGDLVTMAS